MWKIGEYGKLTRTRGIIYSRSAPVNDSICHKRAHCMSIVVDGASTIFRRSALHRRRKREEGRGVIDAGRWTDASPLRYTLCARVNTHTRDTRRLVQAVT